MIIEDEAMTYSKAEQNIATIGPGSTSEKSTALAYKHEVSD